MNQVTMYMFVAIKLLIAVGASKINSLILQCVTKVGPLPVFRIMHLQLLIQHFKHSNYF